MVVGLRVDVLTHLELLRSAGFHWPPGAQPGLHANPRGARPMPSHPVWRAAVPVSCRGCSCTTAAACSQAGRPVMLGHLFDFVIGAVTQVDRSVILPRSVEI